jgi:hypothetical protein
MLGELESGVLEIDEMKTLRQGFSGGCAEINC